MGNKDAGKVQIRSVWNLAVGYAPVFDNDTTILFIVGLQPLPVILSDTVG